MRYILFVGMLCIVSISMIRSLAEAETSSLRQAEDLLGDRQYAEALAVLRNLLERDPVQEEYLRLLMGNAYFYQQEYAAALEQYTLLSANFPDSAWQDKAMFKQADCYIELKQFDRAEEVYEQQIRHLVSPERKERIAQVYLDFAEEYASGKWVTRQGQPGMEPRPDYARARTFYELALRMDIGKQKVEDLRFQIARCAFELGDYASAITTLLQLREDYPQGEHFTEAVFYLGRAYLYQGQRIQARKVFRDFMEDFPDDAHAAEAAFFLTRTYNIPTPGTSEELELGVKALEEFLETYPDDLRVFQAEYEIGLSYYNFSRYDAAAEAFTAYIEQHAGAASPAPAPRAADLPPGVLSPDETLPLARYYLGYVYQQQRKFEQAIQVWHTYLQQHPADKHWSEAQRQLIETEYLIADRLFREEQYEAARDAWEQFLNAHPLDPRNPDIMRRIGDTWFQQERYQDAIAQWQRTVSKYPDTDPASQAQFDIGRALEEKLLKFEEAIDAYQRVTWGRAYPDAQVRLAEMRARRLTVMTERKFHSDETPELRVVTRNIKALTLKMYRVDLETYFRKMQTTDGVDALDIALIDPEQTWQERFENYEAYREFEHHLKMPFREPGAYLVTCSEDKMDNDVGYEATTLVLISDLDVIVKSTRKDLLVFAQNMRTGETYPQVDILVSDGRKVIFEGHTGGDGVLHQALEDLEEVQDLRIFAYTGAQYASNTLGLAELQYAQGLESRGYLYTDRPAYRPGQRVNVRGIVREVDGRGNLRVPAVKSEWDVQVMSPQGKSVYQKEATLNEFGAFALDFQLSAATPTGEYRVVAHRKEHTYIGAFLVEQYTLEQLRLTIETDKEVYFRGETITGTIKAEYYYGEPAKQKPLHYELAGLDTFSGTTDERGELAFSLDTRNFAESQTITLTARLDEDNVRTGKTVWLATRGFTCAVSTIRSVYLKDEHIEVQVETIDPAGNPVEKSLLLEVFSRQTSPYGDLVEVKLSEYPVLTDANGEGRALVQIAEGGDVVLRASGLDRFGNPVSGETGVFISDQDDEVKLRLLADAETVKVGDTPELTLMSRAAAGLGLLTYEADAILSYRILYINEGENPLLLAIESEHAPNFTLAVAQMDGNHFYQAQKEFAVTQGLQIQVKALPVDASEPPEFFQPGERVTVEVRTSDHHGNPVPAEVSLAMVDAALYAKYADHVPPIATVFYDQWRELDTRTNSSCQFRFEAATKEIVEALREEEERFAKEKLEMDMAEGSMLQPMSMAPPAPASGIIQDEAEAPMEMAKERGADATVPSGQAGESDDEIGFPARLREYFPETGYWNPSIVTDAAGVARVTVQLPDSTTEWRFTSRGITHETLVGETTSSLITKLPFFAEIKTPAMLTEGDQAMLLAELHNYSGNTLEVRMSFTGSLGGTVLEQQEQQITSEDSSVLEREYRLDLSKLSSQATVHPVSLEFAASAEAYQDRIKREAPVRPWGIEYVAARSGVLQDDRRIDIELPGDRAYLFREMSILLNPSLERSLVDLTSDVPWSFKAPSSSSIHEAMVVFNALQSLRQAADDPAAAQLQSRLDFLLTDISLRQNQDGGWNWTGRENRSDYFVSADAVRLLALAENAGIPVPVDTLARGVNYLKQAFQSANDNDLKTALLYALAVADDVDFAHVNRVYRERNSLSAPALALLMLTYGEIERGETAAELLSLLQNLAHLRQEPATGKETAHWTSASPYPWLQDSVETTALALLAIQQTAPGDSLVTASVNWLYSQRRWLGWGSLRTNARVSSALLTYFSATRPDINRYILDVEVNGTPLHTLTVDSERELLVLDVPVDVLHHGKNTVRFNFDGRGSLNYVCVLKGVSRDMQKTRDHYELWRYYEPAPLMFEGREIPRGFAVLEGSYSSWRNQLTQIPLGGFGRVSVHYQRQDYDDQQPYTNPRLILEEPIPAGCTVLETSIQGGFLDYEIRDGKLVFYLNNARYGTISYDLYGYLPGEYRVLPGRIRSPYQPHVQDYGEPYQITVLGRGQPVTETYRKTPDELYYYGKALFDAGRYADAQPLLQELFSDYQLEATPYKETARMLMSIAIDADNSGDIVQYFEILKEKYPDLVLSFDDMVRVGQAYRDIREYERAVQVFRAIAEASFLKDLQVSGTLEAQGEFMASIAYTEGILAEYPDLPIIESSQYALAQLVYQESTGTRTRAELTDAQHAWLERYVSAEALRRKPLLGRAIGMLHQFLTLYPEQPIADEINFSLANAYLDLEDFESAIGIAQQAQQRYPQSRFLSGYHYLEGYGNFELERYDAALELCRKVATKQYLDRQGRLNASDHKDLATYIMGQIYHSMGQPEQAIAEYDKVKEQFPDAREAIAYFTRKTLQMEEVSTFQPGDETRVTLDYRNVAEVNVLVYRVDLMKLYLLQKNLNNITTINLAGITPYHQETLTIGEGHDYADREHVVILPLDEAGAYLVVVKESELDSSGMVLLSTLKLDVEEDAASGRVRVNVLNAVTGRYENNVHVKVIGSGDSKFISGSTDLRGIFIADNIHGTATVIARKGDQYAFYRGERILQSSSDTGYALGAEQPMDLRSQATQQLKVDNNIIQQQNVDYLRNDLFQNEQRGVEVKSAY